MNAGSILEIYLAALGWHLYDSIWNSLFEVGILYIPFFLIAGAGWVRGYLAAGLEGAIQAVRDLEMMMLGMFTVVILAGQPVLQLQPAGISYIRPCTNVPLKGGSTGTTYDDTVQIEGIAGKVPVYWYGVMYLAGHFTSSAVAAIPCQTDFRLVEYKVRNTRIRDPDLRNQIQMFNHTCWLWARKKFFENPTDLVAKGYRRDDIDWPGSRYFLETEGYYSHSNPNLANRAPRDIPGFPEDPVWGRRPTCKDWWLDPNVGLHQRLIREVDDQSDVRKLFSVSEKAEDILRAVYAVDAKNLGISVTGAWHYDPNGLIEGAKAWITKQAADFGGWYEKLAFAPKMYAVREAAPILQAVLLMIVYAAMPFILLFGRFSFGTVLALSIVTFAVKFWTFWWALALWLDNTLRLALFGEDGLLRRLTEGPDAYTISDAVFDIVMGLTFVVVPLLWIGMFSWAGYHIGGAINAVLQAKFGAAGTAGARGGEVLRGVAGSAIRRFLGKK